VERDPETGKITRVIHEGGEVYNPLNDPLLTDDEASEVGDDGEEFEGFEDGAIENENENRGGKGTKASTKASTKRGIVAELEEQARFAAPKKIRTQSAREREWVEELVGKYGEDFVGMARDRKLNPMQQSVGELRRKVKTWTEQSGKISA
jgi:nucleolar protein 16